MSELVKASYQDVATITALCEISNTRKEGYLKTRRGQNGGTWLHTDLAVVFARWLDVLFSIWCDQQAKTPPKRGSYGVSQLDDGKPNKLRFDVDEWPAIRSAINTIARTCNRMEEKK